MEVKNDQALTLKSSSSPPPAPLNTTSRNSSIIFVSPTYRYDGQDSFCLDVPEKYIQKWDDLEGLSQPHAVG